MEAEVAADSILGVHTYYSSQMISKSLTAFDSLLQVFGDEHYKVGVVHT